MRSVKVTIAVALALIAAAIGAILARSPLTVAATNSVPASADVEFAKGDVSSCQAGSIPRGTSAIRIAFEARAVGPRIAVKILSRSRVVAEGAQAAGWGAASSVTVPVTPLSHAIGDARICMTVGELAEPFRAHGTTASVSAGRLADVRLRMEYLRPGPKSWWSLAPSIVYNMGLGRAPGGTWVVFLVLALVLAVAALTSRFALDALR